MIRNIAKKSLTLVLSMAMLLAVPVFTGTGMIFSPSEVFAADSIAAVSTAYNGKSPYYVMVNRQMNTVTVYGVGDDGNYSVPVKAMVASCGRSGHATPAGTFSTPDSRYTWRLMVDGTYGQYASRIKGSILFHSICYTSAGKNKMISSEYDALGNHASLGCVRLQTADAKWIYDNCPTGTLVTVYDSPEAGALGKPQRAVQSVSSSPNKNWDPTDPDPKNPWRLEISWAVSGTGHGEVTGVGAYRYGENVTLTAVPDPGSAFECWYDENWNYLSSDPVYTLTADREQRLTASFRKQVSVGVHASASGTASDSLTADPDSQVTVITAPVTQEGGKKADFLGWYDSDGNLFSKDSVYTFTVSEPVELYAMYEGDSYGDIPADAWYLAEAAAAKKAGITNGLTPVLFGADQPFTRAMTVQMIARAAGADTSAPQESSFVDVPVDAWFAGAVRWAAENGIVKGVSETEFAPDQQITRQDMLVMMGRYMASVEEKAKQKQQEPPSGEKAGPKDSETSPANPDSPSGSSTEDNPAQPENPAGNEGAGNGSTSSGQDQVSAEEPASGSDTSSGETPQQAGENGNTGTQQTVSKASDDDLTAVVDDETDPVTAPAPASSDPASQEPSGTAEPSEPAQPSDPQTPAESGQPAETPAGAPAESGQPVEAPTGTPAEPAPGSEQPAQPPAGPLPQDPQTAPITLTYADTADIADYAVTWFVYAQEHGLLKGYEDNTVRPLNILNRAEGTVLIMRMLDSLQKLTV